MILYNTKFLQLKSTKKVNGSDWIYAHRPNAKDVVVIVPIINKTQTLFLIEKRPPLNAENIAEYSLAFPAGLVGDEREGETILEAVKSELLEETGLVANKIKIVNKPIASSPGCVSETFIVAFAFIDKFDVYKQPIDDGGIIIDRVLVDIDNIDLWIDDKQKEGIMLTSQLLSALYFLKKECL